MLHPLTVVWHVYLSGLPVVGVLAFLWDRFGEPDAHHRRFGGHFVVALAYAAFWPLIACALVVMLVDWAGQATGMITVPKTKRTGRSVR